MVEILDKEYQTSQARLKEFESAVEGRKRADEALQVSETRYRRLFETAQDGILLLDADTGKITDVNPFLIDMLGYSHEELLGKKLWDIGFFKDIVASKAAFLDLQTKGYVRYEDLPFETKDGRSIDVEFVSNVYLVNHNKIIQCNIRDITERRQAEKASREARRYAESIIETVHEPLVVLDKDLKVLSANRSFYSTFKVTPGETVGNLIYDIGNRQWDIPSLRKLLEDTLLKNTQFNDYEVSHKFQTIGQKIMLLNARQIHQEVIGTPMILLAIEDITEKRRMEDELSKYREHLEQLVEERTAELKTTNEQLQLDITERKRAEKALKESEEKFRSITAGAMDVIVSMDEHGRIYYFNPAGERIFGYTTEETIGKELHSLLVPGKYNDTYKKGFESFKATGKGRLIGKTTEISALRKDGTEFPVEISISALQIQGKWHAVGIIRDIRERKKLEEIRLENLHLEAADKAKSEFLASMSHELRTPLNASIGFSELLMQGLAGELSEKQKHYVDNVLTSNQFLLSLINDILDLSKIEAGKIELVPEKMSIPVSIKETLTLVKEKALKHNVLLKTEFDPALEFIEADKQRFKQILFNLLSNAVKFSKDEGGIVTIATKKADDMAQISVSDTGIGIKPENMGRLFNKFEQLEPGLSQKYGGTGLGLAITKQLVEKHGGRIWAESKYGEGSTFTFALPLKAMKEKK